MTILVTGAAGFIGYHLSNRLLAQGCAIVGLDNLNQYYDRSLKNARLQLLKQHPHFIFEQTDLLDQEALTHIFTQHKITKVIHMAAQPGVRYSLTEPHAYINSNIIGFTNILECCRHASIEHLIYASSSSVYGANTKQPFQETDATNHPMSLYAATKKSNELMAHSYSSLYNIPTTGLRFFTVYGPWGRPDMALFKFTQKIINEEPIEVFNEGQLYRDFTYVTDIANLTLEMLNHPAQANPDWNAQTPDPSSSYSPYAIYNIGNSQPVKLLDFIRLLETAIGKPAILKMTPMQPGDVHSTYSDSSRIIDLCKMQPTTNIAEGIQAFVAWYQSYYKIAAPV